MHKNEEWKEREIEKRSTCKARELIKIIESHSSLETSNGAKNNINQLIKKSKKKCTTSIHVWTSQRVDFPQPNKINP